MQVRVLCISGSGRSGSTLLSLLLSQNPDVLNLGQLRDLWRAFDEDRSCSCERSLHQCPQWRPAIDAALTGNATAADVHRQMQAFYREVRRIPTAELAASTQRIRSKPAALLDCLLHVPQQLEKENRALIMRPDDFEIAESDYLNINHVTPQGSHRLTGQIFKLMAAVDKS